MACPKCGALDGFLLNSDGTILSCKIAESRLVGVLGYSLPGEVQRRETTRLIGWGGQPERTVRHGWDKAHFIAVSMGGAVDQKEINVFLQRRDLNRGWSPEGKVLRRMESYCATNPGTFCFSRPLYLDETSIPAAVEYGILKPDTTLWVERFSNQY